jgi:hypothetical protein
VVAAGDRDRRREVVEVGSVSRLRSTRSTMPR